MKRGRTSAYKKNFTIKLRTHDCNCSLHARLQRENKVQRIAALLQELDAITRCKFGAAVVRKHGVTETR